MERKKEVILLLFVSENFMRPTVNTDAVLLSLETYITTFVRGYYLLEPENLAQDDEEDSCMLSLTTGHPESIVPSLE